MWKQIEFMVLKTIFTVKLTSDIHTFIHKKICGTYTCRSKPVLKVPKPAGPPPGSMMAAMLVSQFNRHTMILIRRTNLIGIKSMLTLLLSRYSYICIFVGMDIYASNRFCDAGGSGSGSGSDKKHE